MDELLKKLLEADVLSEETKNELEQAMTVKLQEAIDAAKKDATEQVRVELTEQWLTERDTLIEAIDEKITEYLKEEIEELKHDIAAFRDLEAEYATRVVENKAEMAQELQGDLAELVEKLDAFLEIRLNAEFEELREDLEESKKLQFGKKVFESFVTEYRKNFINDDSTEAELRAVTESLEAEKAKRKQLQEKVASSERKMKIEQVLKPLTGKNREIMETILKNVATDGLEEAYKTFIGRVLRESEVDDSEKEDLVLAEGKKDKKEEKKAGKKPAFLFKDGNKKDEEAEEEDMPAKKPVAESWARLAGLME